MSDDIEWTVASAGSVGEVLAKGIADIIRIAAEPDWIPVTERLPEHGDIVSVVTRFGVILAAERDGGKWFHTAPEMVTREINGVTHWMPMPEPPTDGK